MEIDSNPTKADLRNVVAASQLIDPVTDVLDDLNARFLHESARLAKSRTASGEKWIVGREDVLNAVQVVLSEALTEITKALGCHESEPARRKAS